LSRYSKSNRETGRNIGGSSPSCWERPSLLFRVRDDEREPKSEARGRKWGRVIGRRAASPLLES